jgi:hypothetical protein
LSDLVIASTGWSPNSEESSAMRRTAVKAWAHVLLDRWLPAIGIFIPSKGMR